MYLPRPEKRIHLDHAGDVVDLPLSLAHGRGGEEEAGHCDGVLGFEIGVRILDPRDVESVVRAVAGADAERAVLGRDRAVLERQAGEVPGDGGHVVDGVIDHLVPAVEEEKAEDDRCREHQEPDDIPLQEARVLVVVHGPYYMPPVRFSNSPLPVYFREIIRLLGHNHPDHVHVTPPIRLPRTPRPPGGRRRHLRDPRLSQAHKTGSSRLCSRLVSEPRAHPGSSRDPERHPDLARSLVSDCSTCSRDHHGGSDLYQDHQVEDPLLEPVQHRLGIRRTSPRLCPLLPHEFVLGSVCKFSPGA